MSAKIAMMYVAVASMARVAVLGFLVDGYFVFGQGCARFRSSG